MLIEDKLLEEGNMPVVSLMLVEDQMPVEDQVLAEGKMLLTS